MSDLDVEERELKMAQLRADIENKKADTDYKLALKWSEPVKVVAAIVASSAAIFGALFGALGYFLGRVH